VKCNAQRRANAWIPPLALALVASALPACHRSAEEKAKRAAGTEAELRADANASRGKGDARSQVRSPSDGLDPIVHVPVGSFSAGSLPGEAGRNPSAEAGLHSITLGPFRIDRRPRPLSASHAKTTAMGQHGPGVTFDEAQVICAENGGRLCTEVEWERACKGPRSTSYAGGEKPCAEGSCASGYEVEALGAALEWTASSFGTGSPLHGQRVLRGAAKGAADGERRCAGRVPESLKPEGEAVTFRCCYGAPNAERLREPEDRVAFREFDLPLEDLRALLGRDERTRPLAEGASYFREDAAGTVLSRGPGDSMGFTLTTRAVIWAPERGVELLVVAGHSGERTAFVVAYFMADKERVLAGTFIMKNEPGPLALAYAPSIRPRMHFSGCWGCPGETGKLLFRPPESIVLLQP